MAVFNVMVQLSAPTELSETQLAFLTTLGASDVEITDYPDAEGGEYQYRAWVYDMAVLPLLLAYAQTL